MGPWISVKFQGLNGKMSKFGKLYSMQVKTALFALLALGSSVGIGMAKASVVNVYTFGDSTADVGTNNVLLNPLAPRANFYPYGETFGYATGRFSNGKLVNDFIAQSLGLALQTPYLQFIPIFHGNDFASAGSGILDSTNILEGVIPLSTQISQFRSVAAGLNQTFGSTTTASFFRNSIFAFSTGSNDLIFGYFLNPTIQATTSVSAFINTLVSTLATDIQKVIDAGAKKIFVTGLGPLGCIPILLAGEAVLNGTLTTPTGPYPCISEYNDGAQEFNAALQQRVNTFNAAGNVTVVFGKSYEGLSKILANASSLGFIDTTSACCGAGLFNALARCGQGLYTLCRNVSNHIFWDNIHPTERVYQILASQFYNGTNSSVTPINVLQLSQLP